MLATKPGPKSNNWYNNAMRLKIYIFNVASAMHISPTRFDLIIVKLSKVVIKPWMNKVQQACVETLSYVWIW